MSQLESSTLLQLLLMVVLAVFACTKVTLQGRVSRGYIRNEQDSILYNALFFTGVAVFLLLLFPQSVPTRDLVLLASASAIVTTFFQVLYTVTLNAGPVSLTVLICNFSVLLVTTFSVVVFKEKLYYSQIGGIACLIVSMILNTDRSGNEKKGGKKWLILALVTMLVNGMGTCLQKSFYLTEASKVENSSNTYLSVMYAVAAVFAFLLYFVYTRAIKKENSSFGFNLHVIGYAFLIGLVLAVYQKMNMFGIEHIDGTFFYPTFSGMQSVIMTAIGVVLFKDRLSRRQWVGVLFGILSIVLMNLKIGGYIG